MEAPNQAKANAMQHFVKHDVLPQAGGVERIRIGDVELHDGRRRQIVRGADRSRAGLAEDAAHAVDICLLGVDADVVDDLAAEAHVRDIADDKGADEFRGVDKRGLKFDGPCLLENDLDIVATGVAAEG